MGFMWMLLLVAYGQRDPNAYFLTQHIRQSFSKDVSDSMSIQDVFSWANTTLLSNLFGEYPGQRDVELLSVTHACFAGISLQIMQIFIKSHVNKEVTQSNYCQFMLQGLMVKVTVLLHNFQHIFSD